MSTSPSLTWQHTVEIEQIAHVQGDDYETIPAEDPEWGLEDEEIIAHLLQGWYPGEHEVIYGREEDLNTPFLGYVRIVDGMEFLFAHNSRMGYASLSRIIQRHEPEE